MVAWGKLSDGEWKLEKGMTSSVVSSPSVTFGLKGIAVVRAGGTPAVRGLRVRYFSDLGKRITMIGRVPFIFRVVIPT
jgi:hypothetical protein